MNLYASGIDIICKRWERFMYLWD